MKFTTYELVFKGICYTTTDRRIFSRFAKAYEEALRAGKDVDSILAAEIKEMIANRSLQVTSADE